MSDISHETVEEFVVATLAALGAPAADIVPDAAFEDLGLDSLDVTDLGTRAENEFGLDLAPRDFEEAEHVRDALAVIWAKAGLPPRSAG